MPSLIDMSKRFLEWAQALPEVMIPAGLEGDMKEAIAAAEDAALDAHDYNADNTEAIRTREQPEPIAEPDGASHCVLCGSSMPKNEIRCRKCHP